jgi:hypothetical protein
MNKTIYRICIIVCLFLAITAGILLYRNQNRQEVETQWLLV